jgi:hypothetical protein
MAYTAPTAADLKARFPAFSAVDNAVVTQALADAARLVDESWTEGDFATARVLYAAHVLTLDGLGTGGEAALILQLPPGFKRMKAGGSEIERASSSSSSSGSSLLLDQTSYGLRFRSLLRRNRGGALAL